MNSNLPAIPTGYGLSVDHSARGLEAVYTSSARTPITLDVDMGGTGYVHLYPTDGPTARVIVWTEDSEGISVDQVRGATLSARGDTWTVYVPPVPPGAGGGMQGVTFNRHGGISVQSVSGNVVMVGRRVYINGVEATPGNSRPTSPVHVEAWLPNLSSAAIRGEQTQIESHATLIELRFNGDNCTVNATGTVGELTGETTNGAIYAARVGAVDVESTNGDVEVADIRGGGRIRTTNSAIRVGSSSEDRPQVVARTTNADIIGTGTVQLDGRTANGRVIRR